jgi:hypothetical protein
VDVVPSGSYNAALVDMPIMTNKNIMKPKLRNNFNFFPFIYPPVQKYMRSLWCCPNRKLSVFFRQSPTCQHLPPENILKYFRRDYQIQYSLVHPISKKTAESALLPAWNILFGKMIDKQNQVSKISLTLFCARSFHNRKFFHNVGVKVDFVSLIKVGDTRT